MTSLEFELGKGHWWLQEEHLALGHGLYREAIAWILPGIAYDTRLPQTKPITSWSITRVYMKLKPYNRYGY